MFVTKSMRVFFLPGLECVGGGPVWGERAPLIIEAPGQRVINLSAHQTSHAQTNYGVFDQYLTKTKTFAYSFLFFVHYFLNN